MDPRGLAPCSYPEATINTRGESRIPGRSREQTGKKRKYDDAGKHSKGFKKRKEGVKQVLNSLGKQVQQLDNIIADQENLTDKLMHRTTLGPEAFEVLREESAILFPDSDDLDVLMLETKRLSDIISPLKHRSEMLDKRVQLLCEMMLLEC
ncbi:hypothetical protein SADUNF_Sadunf03G0117200 [Salix dunnii]|uniref:Uncharacterized protein n=1 Tax=Salix dunnii TaxID=1413687 RepID=A0A835TGA2_9ROSI|nr:hypothetical protein SADUNF_Sadunf03G0117200 [Salix dunnii]